ncbi:WbqC family protein [Variovorax sp. PBL-E5]|uniref:WbqC family protein n=1 Tax=Variovorax sp. PBL-E5 TaxID=434014 RepID=UPI001316585A|nr:WbqC family protein [Variovorax sp. PBL-E5]VTU18895.1 WbqC-like protein family protein [Variovorax sp. PBL-E5]
MRKIAIVQSNYIPWKGYFDLIARVDEFVLYDDMQYTRRDWRNRNQIKTPQGLHWLTVPVIAKGKYTQKIKDTEIDGTAWAELHWKAFEQNYKRAACFNEVADWLAPYYFSSDVPTHLSVLNRRLIEAICGYLKIETKISSSSDYALSEGKTERLADICVQAGASEYFSGPSARDYVDESIFAQRGIGLHWFDYSGYGEYPQLWGEFTHEVTILDLLFNCGREAPGFMRYIGK